MATITVTPTQTFVSGNTVTPATLNQLAQSTVALTAGTIVAADIASDAVTTAKILDANVTTAKILDANVTTAKIADSAVTPAKLSQPYTLATSVASTSGTSINFTPIPSWAKRVTVIFSGVSTSGTSEKLIQLGAGSVTTSGYAATSSAVAGSVATMQSTAGFPIFSVLAADSISGALTFDNVTGNTWIGNGVVTGNSSSTLMQAGSIALSGTLDRIRITTVNGSDTFDAGTINIAYEG